MKEIILYTGGSRSGKSSQALRFAEHYKKKGFIATSEAFDDEMQDRINKHKEERGEDYITIEEPVEIVEALRQLSSKVDVILLDCLTVWVGNLMHYCSSDEQLDDKINEFIAYLSNPDCTLILVTNEVGMGIIPDNAMSRKFRDTAGWLNQRVAKKADRVTLTVSGIPLNLKS